VVEDKELTATDVTDTSPLVFMPCSGTELQSWSLDNTGSLFVEKSTWKCVDISNYGAGPRLDTYSCSHAPQQRWERRIIPNCDSARRACSQIVNPSSNRCITKVTTSGAAIGLDAGTSYAVAQALPCVAGADPSQVFDLARGDQGGFPEAFPVRSRGLCMQPYISKEPTFDAVAFQTPDGTVSLVAQNKGDESLSFTIYDQTLGLGASGVTVPPHSIQSYKLPSARDPAAPLTTVSLAKEAVSRELPKEKAAKATAARTSAVPASFSTSSTILLAAIAISALLWRNARVASGAEREPILEADSAPYTEFESPSQSQ